MRELAVERELRIFLRHGGEHHRVDWFARVVELRVREHADDLDVGWPGSVEADVAPERVDRWQVPADERLIHHRDARAAGDIATIDGASLHELHAHRLGVGRSDRNAFDRDVLVGTRRVTLDRGAVHAATAAERAVAGYGHALDTGQPAEPVVEPHVHCRGRLRRVAGEPRVQAREQNVVRYEAQRLTLDVDQRSCEKTGGHEQHHRHGDLDRDEGRRRM